ncbi:MAG TPA: glycosyltransferase family 39 protein [Solirubrobacteraceae bacterium]|nr:glycosyltransferase family 39 protein [Solirubrobacteraceae bacterium]
MSSVLAGDPPARARTAAAPDRHRARRANTLVGVLVCVAAAAPIAVYLWIALHRIGYPYELDWMEGGSVGLAARVAAGHSLYVAPSLSFVGWTYTPFYYVVAAAVSKLTGVGFLPLRLVSLIASLSSMATLAWIVRRETRDRVAGLVAAGLFAATFAISGAWFDTGRVDSLFVALTLLAVAFGRSARSVRGGVGLGVLCFLAFFTKQSALLALVPVLLYLAVIRRRVGVSALLTLVALVVGSTLVLQAASHGWYGYYIYGELLHQPVATTLWRLFWTQDIIGHEWPLVMLVVGGAATLAWTGRGRLRFSSPVVYYVVAAAGLIGSAYVSRLHTGGWVNVLIPAYAATALLAGLTYGAVVTGRHGGIARPVLAAVVLLQLVLLPYSIGAQIPTAADRATGAELITALRGLPGRTIVLRHPWYATLARKTGTAQGEAITDVLRSSDTRGSRALLASLHRALDAEHIDAVVVDYPGEGSYFGPEFTRDFRLQRRQITPSPLYPLTDLRSAPTFVYLRVHGPR